MCLIAVISFLELIKNRLVAKEVSPFEVEI